MIRRGDRISILPEWQDQGDDQIEYIAIDDEEKGRVSIQAQLGLPINPIHMVATYMIRKEAP
jgi:hypothetical protein